MRYYNNFLTLDECDFIIKYFSNIESYNMINDNRNLEIHQVSDYNHFKFLEKKLGEINIINNPTININKYNQGCYFLPHVDNGGFNDPNHERLQTVVINLSDNNTYVGGNLYIDNKLIELTQGSAVIFNSHTVHEVKEITRGFRYSLVLWLKESHIKKSTI